MPAFGNAGLYNFTVDSSWNLVESGTVDGKYVVVYGYNEVLTPGTSTTVLSNSLTMVDMSNADYTSIEDINVTISAYACDVGDVDSSTAWESVKANYGL